MSDEHALTHRLLESAATMEATARLLRLGASSAPRPGLAAALEIEAERNRKLVVGDQPKTIQDSLPGVRSDPYGISPPESLGKPFPDVNADNFEV